MYHNYKKLKKKKKISRLILVYNKKAGNNSNYSPSRFITLYRLLEGEKILPNKVIFFPDQNIEFDVKDGDIFLVFGGDGTLSYLLTSLKKSGAMGRISEIFLAHLRGGTMNTIASSLRIPKPSQLLKKIQSYISSEEIEVIPRNVLFISTEKDFLAGIIFGAITPYKFLQDYYSGKIQGPVGGAKTIIRALSEIPKNEKNILRFERCKLNVYLSDEKMCDLEIEKDFFIIGASTIHTFGLNFSNFPKAPYSHNNFNALAYSGSVIKLGFFLPLIWFGILPKESLNELAVKIDIESEREIGFTVDGDLYTARKISVSSGDQVFFIT
jgi:diacylglycerol kinase family enzyme